MTDILFYSLLKQKESQQLIYFYKNIVDREINNLNIYFNNNWEGYDMKIYKYYE